ncbi:MAG TPA: hypothetical protein VJJ98_08405 [Sedimentisphaerales bacterium]|nr:hypothetical protein [Sedimentisphaerales bacterium]
MKQFTDYLLRRVTQAGDSMVPEDGSTRVISDLSMAICGIKGRNPNT